MSEYQYYEFLAVDRPLTEKEMDELRRFSGRAEITPTNFVVSYSYGDFKGDADLWMEKYFDAFLSMACWGTHTFKLRLPARFLDPTTLQAYHSHEDVFSYVRKGEWLILTFSSEEEGGGDWVEGEGILASLVCLRSDLARGDLRALYLAWLAGAEYLDADEEDEEDASREPPVPAGLGELSPALSALAELLRVAPDLITAAAEASPPLRAVEPDPGAIRSWIARLPAEEKDDYLAGLFEGRGASLSLELQHRFRKEKADGLQTGPRGARMLEALRERARAIQDERRRAAAAKAAAEKASREREAAAARERRLTQLVGNESTAWDEVRRLVESKLPKNYDEAVQLLLDLRTLAERIGTSAGFDSRFRALADEHSRKGTFLERVRKAGL